MKLLDLKSLPVPASVGSTPTVGVLKAYGKFDGKGSDNFHSLLESSIQDMDGTKVSAGFALLSRRSVKSESVDAASKPAQQSPESAGVQNDAQTPEAPACAAPEKGAAKSEQGTKDASAQQTVETKSAGPDNDAGLDPADAELEAAAYAAAALLAQAAAAQVQQAAPEAEVDSTAAPAPEPAPSTLLQVNLREMQTAFRPALDSKGQETVSAGTAGIVNPDANAGPADSSPAAGGKSVLSALPVATTEAKIADPSAAPKSLASGVLGSSQKTDPLAAKLSAAVALNPNLNQNKVAEAISAYSTVQAPVASVGTILDVVVPAAESLQAAAEQVAMLGQQGAADASLEDTAVQPDSSASQASDLQVDVPLAQVPNDESKDDSGSSAPYDSAADSRQGKQGQKLPVASSESASAANPNVSPVKVEARPEESSSSKMSSRSSSSASSEDDTAASKVSAAGSDKPHVSHDAGASVASVAGAATSAQAEVPSKPVIEGPHHVHDNVALWKTVADAVQRVRSENPSHLAVDLRLADGHSISLELRMGQAGLQASFKSESQSLLKALETQWTAFVDRTSAEPVKVVSTVFESRTGPDWSSGGGGDANEKRQAFEDSSAAAALAAENLNFSLELPKDLQIDPTPKLAAALGRINLYA